MLTKDERAEVAEVIYRELGDMVNRDYLIDALAPAVAQILADRERDQRAALLARLRDEDVVEAALEAVVDVRDRYDRLPTDADSWDVARAALAAVAAVLERAADPKDGETNG